MTEASRENIWIGGSPGAKIIKVLGLVLVLIPVLLMVMKTSAGIDPKTLWFVSVLGIGVCVLGLYGSRGAWRFGAVAASLFIGGAAQLWLTQPLWFPALVLKPSLASGGVMGGIIALQAGLALWVLWSGQTRDSVAKFIHAFGPARLLLFLILSVAFSVSAMSYLPGGDYVSYVAHLVAAGALISINLLSVLALVSQPVSFPVLDRLHPIYPAGVVFVASAVLAWFAFERMPHVEDELVYLFQARTLLGGALWVPAPPEAAQAGLEYYLLQIDQGNWFATTPPAWPAVLALGVMVGAPWLVNPVLIAVSVLLAYSIARQLLDARRAGLVVLFMCTSPWVLGTAASLMPHASSLFFTLLTWWLLLRCDQALGKKIIGLALLAGFSMGWVFVTRQLEGLMLGTLTGLWLLRFWRRDMGIGRIAAYSVGCILVGSLYLGFNAAMTGNPLVAPLDQYVSALWQSGANAYGFGPDIGPPDQWNGLDVLPGHGPIEGVLNTLQNLLLTHMELLGWGVGSLALVWSLFIWGKIQQVDRMMLGIIAVVIGAMFFYWFSGSFYVGPRYWFSLMFPLLILSVNGLDALLARADAAGLRSGSIGGAVVVLCLFGLLVFTPWRGVEKYYAYGTYRDVMRTEMKAGTFGNALVFVKINGDAGSALYLNDPWLPPDRALFIRDLGPDINAGAIAAYPDRDVVYYRDGVVTRAEN